MVKAIFFDLFETLITESHAVPRRASSLGFDLGIEPDVFRVEWTPRRQAVILGHISFSDALAQICAVAGRPVENLTLERLCQERVRAKSLAFSRIEPQILTALDELRKQGICLGVISNCFAEDVMEWPACVLSPLFDCTLFSFEVHLAKPDPAIYEAACRWLGADPAVTMFISDGTDELMGAERMGIQSFQALWFLKRWPHFREHRLYARSLSKVEDLLSHV